jgi:hypothetical protein
LEGRGGGEEKGLKEVVDEGLNCHEKGIVDAECQ